jgi:hypothetical protein
MVSASAAAATISLRQGMAFYSGPCLIAAALSFGLFARSVRVCAKASPSRTLRALERMRSYIANEPPSFEKPNKPKQPAP